MAQFDLQEARRHYSDAQILQYLQKRSPNFNAEEAKKHYSEPQMVEYLAGHTQPPIPEGILQNYKSGNYAEAVHQTFTKLGYAAIPITIAGLIAGEIPLTAVAGVAALGGAGKLLADAWSDYSSKHFGDPGQGQKDLAGDIGSLMGGATGSKLGPMLGPSLKNIAGSAADYLANKPIIGAAIKHFIPQARIPLALAEMMGTDTTTASGAAGKSSPAAKGADRFTPPPGMIDPKLRATFDNSNEPIPPMPGVGYNPPAPSLQTDTGSLGTGLQNPPSTFQTFTPPPRPSIEPEVVEPDLNPPPMPPKGLGGRPKFGKPDMGAPAQFKNRPATGQTFSPGPAGNPIPEPPAALQAPPTPAPVDQPAPAPSGSSNGLSEYGQTVGAKADAALKAKSKNFAQHFIDAGRTPEQVEGMGQNMTPDQLKAITADVNKSQGSSHGVPRNRTPQQVMSDTAAAMRSMSPVTPPVPEAPAAIVESNKVDMPKKAPKVTPVAAPAPPTESGPFSYSPSREDVVQYKKVGKVWHGNPSGEFTPVIPSISQMLDEDLAAGALKAVPK